MPSFFREEYAATFLCLLIVFANPHARASAVVGVLWSVCLHALLAIMAQRNLSRKKMSVTRKLAMIATLALFTDALTNSSTEAEDPRSSSAITERTTSPPPYPPLPLNSQSFSDYTLLISGQTCEDAGYSSILKSECEYIQNNVFSEWTTFAVTFHSSTAPVYPTYCYIWIGNGGNGIVVFDENYAYRSATTNGCAHLRQCICKLPPPPSPPSSPPSPPPSPPESLSDWVDSGTVWAGVNYVHECYKSDGTTSTTLNQHKTYSSQDDAKAACSNIPECNYVYEYKCDNNHWRYCTIDSFYNIPSGTVINSCGAMNVSSSCVNRWCTLTDVNKEFRTGVVPSSDFTMRFTFKLTAAPTGHDWYLFAKLGYTESAPRVYIDRPLSHGNTFENGPYRVYVKYGKNSVIHVVGTADLVLHQEYAFRFVVVNGSSYYLIRESASSEDVEKSDTLPTGVNPYTSSDGPFTMYTHKGGYNPMIDLRGLEYLPYSIPPRTQWANCKLYWCVPGGQFLEYATPSDTLTLRFTIYIQGSIDTTASVMHRLIEAGGPAPNGDVSETYLPYVYIDDPQEHNEQLLVKVRHGWGDKYLDLVGGTDMQQGSQYTFKYVLDGGEATLYRETATGDVIEAQTTTYNGFNLDALPAGTYSVRLCSVNCPPVWLTNIEYHIGPPSPPPLTCLQSELTRSHCYYSTNTTAEHLPFDYFPQEYPGPSPPSGTYKPSVLIGCRVRNTVSDTNGWGIHYDTQHYSGTNLDKYWGFRRYGGGITTMGNQHLQREIVIMLPFNTTITPILLGFPTTPNVVRMVHLWKQGIGTIQVLRFRQIYLHLLRIHPHRIRHSFPAQPWTDSHL